MKATQRKQILVRLENKKSGEKFIKFLEEKGFSNVQNLTFDNLKVKVLVVDSDVFFSTNVTCLASLSSCGITPIRIEEFKQNF